MDTLIKVRTDLRYLSWRSYTTPLRILLVSICIAVTTAFILMLQQPSTSVQTILSESYRPEQASHQQVAERYRDPSLAYFFGK